MKITFEIYYHTRWGESLMLSGETEQLGSGDESRAVVMDCRGGDLWSYTIEVPATIAAFEYRYLVKSGDSVRREWNRPHRFVPGQKATEYRLLDRWRDTPADLPFYSSAFTQGIFFRQHPQPQPGVPAAGTVTFKIFAPQLRPDEQLLLVGSVPALGNWEPSQAPALDDTDFPEWHLTLDAAQLGPSFEYKFVVVRTQQREVVAWETGANRVYTDSELSPSTAVVVSGLLFNGPERPWKGAGTAIPVFSLRTDYGFGTGEFLDLKYLVDWALRTGQSFIQLLPVNDTTLTGSWCDSYPYNANSTFALHPQYLRLSEVGRLSDEARQAQFDALQRELNMQPDVDYERVNRAKMEYLNLLFDEQGDDTLSSEGFKQFFKENKFWLQPYAAFSSLRDRFKTADFTRWGEFASYDESMIADYCAVWSPWYRSVALYYYIQYHLHLQLSEVRDYAHRAGVVLKGDIPIGISRTSVDAWVNPDLFRMNCQAGAPPDDFSIEGQNWGFPTYDWEVMARDGYAWWKARLRHMSRYFDAYRIDHILGFFRIWEIPLDAVHGLLGHFHSAMPLSPDELAQKGFRFDASWQTVPYVREESLHDIFGAYTDEVKTRFLVDKGNGRWDLNVMMDTQRKVVDYFSGADDEMNVLIRDGLLKLLDEVLFLEDPDQPGYYHPRIMGNRTQAYQALDDEQKACFDRLYEDFFYWRHNDFWKAEALRKLPVLVASTDMLVCGEDLGMIPGCVPEVMKQLQILSLEIQRMPKEWNCEFGDVSRYPVRSVCTTSTHDMSGIRGWWQEDPARTQRYFNEVLGESGQAPATCEPWICERMVELTLSAPSMLAILPLQDWLSIDGRLRRKNPDEERINIPACPHYYWRYRMHLSLEQLLAEGVFNTRLQEMIARSGR
ncbi:4-alpha-glucanotransferase [Barnesiella sp. An22]|uniref:4-alpha-glucanotransferase n=1 Tax=Barnesiella sp. An22 TaxID=1965590 RepID=UPI000B3AB2B1|nr:4-alpha-glucanotransferase [Barnesiella sp. An22]OUO99578.1 4-alpha-glucanotransferase [Barnesiella sp. An22]